ncbi:MULTISPECIES: YobI family P-loop NTPase [Clostridia]|uniref:YobI family P-loop NTPase n=1 Tax=Clostridia TaxID=186801 RepID=UPI000E5D61B2|nr:hypothetical protein DWY02_13115 [Eubacterium sp. AF22-9]
MIGEDDKSSSLANDWTLDDVDENVIEEGILKQLFYRVDVGKIPQSRYRKIKKLSYWKMFFTLLMLTVVASLFILKLIRMFWKTLKIQSLIMEHFFILINGFSRY